jgi:hypothetical protein
VSSLESPAWPRAAACAQPAGVIVNDLHSRRTATRVARVAEPDTLDAVRGAIAAAKREHRARRAGLPRRSGRSSDHNDLYHVIQIAAMTLFYPGVRWLRDGQPAPAA